MLIKEKFERTHFSNSEQTIIDYINLHPKEIKEMTTKDIANATFTSPSTLIRIAHKMNFNGWNDLKEAFLKENQYLETHFCEIDANFPFKKNDTIMSIANKIAILKQETIQDTLSLLTHDDLQKAIRIMRNASCIELFSVSNNTLITKEFMHNMKRIQKKVDMCDIQGELIFTAVNMDKKGCAIIISYSGETPILKRVAEALKANHIPIIVITNIGENTLSKMADCVLKITTREKLYSKISTFTTDTAIIYLLDVLYSCIFALDYDYHIKLKTSNSNAIETGRYSTLSILKEEEHFDL